MNTNITAKAPHQSRGGPDRPRRPLSAYNLFYRYKRQIVLSALSANDSSDLDKDAIIRMVETPPGLEYYNSGSDESAPSQDVLNAFQRRAILAALASNMEAKDTRSRLHRTNGAMNGLIGFVELGKLMNDCWKKCDPFAKSVFNELSQGQRERYRQLMVEFNAHNKGQVKSSKVEEKRPNTKKGHVLKNPPPLLHVGGADEDASNKFSLAETMLQLKKSAPSSNSDGNHNMMSGTLSNSAMDPSLLAHLSEQEHPSDVLSQFNSMAANSHFQFPAPNPTPNSIRMSLGSSFRRNSASNTGMDGGLDYLGVPNRSAFAPSIQGLPAPQQSQHFGNVPTGTGGMDDMQRLALRAGELEEERLLMRLRELENEMSRRRARQGALRSFLESRGAYQSIGSAQTGTTVPSYYPVDMQDGLWSQMYANTMMQPNNQATERAAMFERIGDLPHGHVMGSKRSSETSGSPQSSKFGPNKKARHD